MMRQVPHFYYALFFSRVILYTFFSFLLIYGGLGVGFFWVGDWGLGLGFWGGGVTISVDGFWGQWCDAFWSLWDWGSVYKQEKNNSGK